jgi:hypothetical protein
MPFFLNNLVPAGGNNRAAPAGSNEAAGRGAFTLWLYRTEDAAAAVDNAGYFNAARALLTPGDVIMRVTINASGVPQTFGWHLVNDVPTTGNVDVTDTTAGTVTDTD